MRQRSILRTIAKCHLPEFINYFSIEIMINFLQYAIENNMLVFIRQLKHLIEMYT